MMTDTPTIRRGSDRGQTDLGWLKSRHSFSFGNYFDPSNASFQTLRVINDDWIEPGGGFGEHGHNNMEILTWVLEGAVEHGDSLGHTQILRPGELQVMTAGSGIRHSEFNASKIHRTHLLQIWITPAERDAEPRYEQKVFDAADRHNQWDTLAAGRGPAKTLVIGQDAAMKVADLDKGQSLTTEVASGRHGYLHVAQGEVTLDGHHLIDGDAVTFSAPTAPSIQATRDAQLILFDLA